MRVLIIGGTGVISTGITPRLLERGDEVVLFNRGNTRPEFSGDYELIIGDRSDHESFERTMQSQEPFDCVIEMIGFTPGEVESDIRAFKGRTSQFIFCSTIDVYTKPAEIYPITETAERSPVASFPYAFDKARCEQILESAHGDDLPVTIIRPAHTYVRRLVHTLREGSYWIDRMRKSMPVIVHGDGQSFWGSTHRDDVARAFVNAVGNDSAVGEDYHVTAEEWLTWNRYYQLVAKAAGAPEPELIHIPTDLLVETVPEAEWCGMNFQYDNIFDNSKAKRDLNFEYTIPFLEGVTTAIKQLDDRGEMESADDYPWYDDIIRAWAKSSEAMRRLDQDRQT